MSNFFEVAKKLKKSSGATLAFINDVDIVEKYLRSLTKNSTVRHVTDNIEHVISQVESDIRFATSDDERRRLIEIQSAILWMCSYTVHISQEYLQHTVYANPVSNERGFDAATQNNAATVLSGPVFYDQAARFAAGLHDRADDWRLDFVTFNYDIGLDASLMCRGIPFAYPGSKSPFRASTGGEVIVCRPHGCVAWSHSDSEPTYHRLSSIVADFNRVPLSPPQRSYTLGLPIQYRSEANPLIVPPQFSKSEFFRHTVITSQLQAAHELLREADILIVVGYSMPASDAETASWIRGALSQGPLHFAYLCDSKQEIIDKYKNMFGSALDGKVRVIPDANACWAEVLRHLRRGHFNLPDRI